MHFTLHNKLCRCFIFTRWLVLLVRRFERLSTESKRLESFTIREKDFNEGIRYSQYRLVVSFKEIRNLAIEACWLKCKQLAECKAISIHMISRTCYLFDHLRHFSPEPNFTTISTLPITIL